MSPGPGPHLPASRPRCDPQGLSSVRRACRESRAQRVVTPSGGTARLARLPREEAHTCLCRDCQNPLPRGCAAGKTPPPASSPPLCPVGRGAQCWGLFVPPLPKTAGPAKPVSCPDHVTQQSRAEAGARPSPPAPGLRPTRSSAVPPRSSTDVALATCRLVSTLTGPRSLPGLERLLVLKTQLAPDPRPPHFPGSCCGDGGVSAGLGGASHGASSGNWHVRKRDVTRVSSGERGRCACRTGQGG